MKRILSILLMITAGTIAHAQGDSLQTRYNTIKINLMSSYWYKNSGAISFERIFKPNQTWGVTVGYVQLPELRNIASSVQVDAPNSKHSGYMFGWEYRVYLKNENKFPAPRGVYLGPYANFYDFRNTHALTFTSSTGAVSSANLKSEINVVNIGFQLGYQFVLNNRWAIDMVVFGPSVSHYAMNLNLEGNFDVTEEAILGNQFLTALTDRFPAVKTLLTDQNVNVHGNTSTWATGFRYQLNVGYHFGRK